MKKYDTILFDFDYTLADSSKGAVMCIDYALEKLDFDAVSKEKAKSTIGLSLADTLQALKGSQHDDITDEFARLFVEKADMVMADATVMLSDVNIMIPLIYECGYKLGIVSTKYRYRIKSILEREGLYKYFTVIIGGEDVNKHKPHPECIDTAVDKIKSDKQKVLYVGDSITDENAAKNAGVDFCVMLTGVTDRSSFDGMYAKQYCCNIRSFYNWLIKV